MGRGFYVKFSFQDLRYEALDYRLKKIHSYGDWVDFTVPDAINNKITTRDYYCEFSNCHNASGDAEYEVVTSVGDPIARLEFKFKQVCSWSWGIPHHSYHTNVKFLCGRENYALKFGSQIYVPGAYPENWTEIPGMPNDSQHIEISVFYMGNAPISPDKYCWLTSHNAFANEAEGWIYYQQYEAFKNQLLKGVRAFMLDTHLKDNDVVLAHGGTSIFYSSLKLGSFVTLNSYLSILTDFLKDHPSETVFLFIENAIIPDDPVVDVVKNYTNYLYGKEIETEDKQYWSYPGLKEKSITLKNLDGKFLIFTSDPKDSWIPYTYDYCIETTFGNESLSDDFEISCKQRGASKATNDTVNNFPFFILNQFPDWDIFLTIKIISGNSLILLALGVQMQRLGIIGATGLLASAISEEIHQERIRAINNGDLIIRKMNYVSQKPIEVDKGIYGKYPTFLAIDFVLSGSAIDSIGFAIEHSIKNYMSQHSSLNPSTIYLAEYLLADRTDVSAYLIKQDGTRTELVVDFTDKQIQLPHLDDEYEVHIKYGNDSEILVGRVAFSYFTEIKAYFFEYKRKYIDLESYITYSQENLTYFAYIKGLFSEWIDLDTGEKKTSSTPIETLSKLDIIDELKAIDVNFINIKGVNGSNVYEIHIKTDTGENELCGTCFNDMIGLMELPVAKEDLRIKFYRTSAKKELPEKFYSEKIPEPLLSIINKLQAESKNCQLVPLPSVTSIYAYLNGKDYPECLISKFNIIKSTDKTYVCDLKFNAAALVFDFNCYQLDTNYEIIAIKNDNSEIKFAIFSIKINDQEERIFSTFRYLVSGV